MSDFETVPVGTMEELKKVKAERDEAFAKGKQVFEDLRRVEAKFNEMERLRRDRDALAAHGMLEVREA